MNAGKAPEPHPRYVFMIGRMDPGESCIILNFDTEEVFPREKTIRLELVEFDTCFDATHDHFGNARTSEFPALNVPYQPVVNVQRPAPLPAIRRRRTDYYVPRMTGTWLPPLLEDSDEDEDSDEETSSSDEYPPPTKKRKPIQNEDDDDNDSFHSIENDDTENAAQENIYDIEDDMAWLAPPSDRFKRANFKDSKIQLDLQFQLHGARFSVLTNLGADRVTFSKLLMLLNTGLKNLENRVFCGLHSHDSPRFSFVNDSGTEVTSTARQRIRIKLTIPPRSSVMFEEGAVWKMLGFTDNNLITAMPKKGTTDQYAKRIRNSHDSESQHFLGNVAISSTSYISTAQGLTAGEWGRVGSFTVGFYVDIFKVSLSWDTDYTLLSQPANQEGSVPPKVKASLFILNNMIALGLQALLLKDDAFRFNVVKGENKMICPKAEMIKPDPSPISQGMAHPFSVTMQFGPDAAKALGLASSTSPINLVSGQPFRPIPNAFLSMETDHSNAQDGGGLSWEKYLNYLFNSIVLDAQDEKNELNAQLDSNKRSVQKESFPLPSWALQAARQDLQPESPPQQPQEVEAGEQEARREVFENIALGIDPLVPQGAEAAAIAEEVVQDNDPDVFPPNEAVNPNFNFDAPDEVEARNVLAEREQNRPAVETDDLRQQRENRQRLEAEEAEKQRLLAAEELANQQKVEAERVRVLAAQLIEKENARKKAEAEAAEVERQQLLIVLLTEKEDARKKAEAEEKARQKAAAERQRQDEEAEEAKRQRQVEKEEAEELVNQQKAALEVERKKPETEEEEALRKAADKQTQEEAETEAQIKERLRLRNEFLKNFDLGVAQRIEEEKRKAAENPENLDPNARELTPPLPEEENIQQLPKKQEAHRKPIYHLPPPTDLEDIPEETTQERQAAENDNTENIDPNYAGMDPSNAPNWLLNNYELRMSIFTAAYSNSRWWPFFLKWEGLIEANPEVALAMNNFERGLGSDESRRDPINWGIYWIRWDDFFRNNVDDTPALQRLLQTEEEHRAEAEARNYMDVDLEPDFMVELTNPSPPVVRSSIMDIEEFADEGPGYYGGGPDGPDDGNPYGDDDDERLRLQPFDVVQEPNPLPQPPDTFNTWTQWPIPTCPAVNAPNLPDFLMLLSRDGIRRDHVGPFGLDSLLAKIRNRRHITYKNYCIIRSPGRLSRLSFEVIDAGFNPVFNETDDPFLIRMGFIYHTLSSETDVIPYT